MILVDTSVLIGYLKGQDDARTLLFDELQTRKIPFGISPYTLQEVLQGARNEEDYQRLWEYLSTQIIYFLPEEISTYEKAARLYFDLRRKGLTPRSTIDILIALTALEHNLMLLHNDRDFDLMAEQLEELKILRML